MPTQEAEIPLSKSPVGDFTSMLPPKDEECAECGAPGYVVPPNGRFIHLTEKDANICHQMRK